MPPIEKSTLLNYKISKDEVIDFHRDELPQGCIIARIEQGYTDENILEILRKQLEVAMDYLPSDVPVSYGLEAILDKKFKGMFEFVENGELKPKSILEVIMFVRDCVYKKNKGIALIFNHIQDEEVLEIISIYHTLKKERAKWNPAIGIDRFTIGLMVLSNGKIADYNRFPGQCPTEYLGILREVISYSQES